MRGALTLGLLAACGADSAGPARVFDPCDATAVAAASGTDDQLASIDDALAMWGSHGAARLSRADGAAIAIEFRDAPTAMYGFYDPPTATAYINTRLADRTVRAIVIAHELGHALGLVHVASRDRTSVMNPGNLTAPPNESDAAALAALWGSCDDYQPSSATATPVTAISAPAALSP